MPAPAEVAVLFARADSIYRQLPGCDVWDEARDALRWPGGVPVVAHPPCRGWGRMSHFARPEPGELELGLWAADQVRQHGGVLEHPAWSKLWPAAGLPAPGGTDQWGGWTLPISQRWWGHKAEKLTWLYIVGVGRRDIPDVPLRLGEATHVVCSSRRDGGVRLVKGMPGWRPGMKKPEREATPHDLAAWLVELARRTRSSGMEHHAER